MTRASIGSPHPIGAMRPSKQPVCAARANLKESVTALANPVLLAGGKAGIQSAIDTAGLEPVPSRPRSFASVAVELIQKDPRGLALRRSANRPARARWQRQAR